MTSTDARKTPRKTGTRTRRKRSAAIGLGDLAERFLKHLETVGKSRATVFSYSLEIGTMTRALGGDTDVKNVTEKQVGTFFRSDTVTKTRAGKAKSQLTINKTRRVGRQFFEWATTEGILASSPAPADAIPTPKRKPDALDPGS